MKSVDIQNKGCVPHDKKFIELFKKVILREISCFEAKIKTEGVKKFREYEPNVPDVFIQYVFSQIKSLQFPELHVYQNINEEFFTMSDDYVLYKVYLTLGMILLPCIVLGNIFNDKFVIEKKKIDYSKDPEIVILPYK